VLVQETGDAELLKVGETLIGNAGQARRDSSQESLGHSRHRLGAEFIQVSLSRRRAVMTHRE